MATFSSLLPWADNRAGLKAHLEIGDDLEDHQLEIFWKAAIAKADTYTENTDYETAAEVPAPILLGCYCYVQALRDFWGRPAALVSAKTGALAETYRNKVAAQAAIEAAGAHWIDYQQNLLRRGKG